MFQLLQVLASTYKGWANIRWISEENSLQQNLLQKIYCTTSPLNLLKIRPLSLSTLIHLFLSLSEAVLESSFVSLRDVIKNMADAVAECHTERQACKNIMLCPHPPDSSGLASGLALCTVKVTMKDKRFEPVQDTEAAITVQLKALRKEDSGKWQRWCEIEVRGSILRINDTVLFAVINVLEI